MIEYIIKILGVQFAANPDYRFGDPETPEMWAKTIALLTELRDTMPRVVLKAEPTNSHDNRAVMVRAMGRKIGYVCRTQRDKIRSLVMGSKRGMLGAEIREVVIGKHGYLYITLRCEESTAVEAQEPGFNWMGWHTDIPLLPPMDALNAEEEAEFILEEELLPSLADADTTELQTYLGIWMAGSRHDISQEACSQRQQYIKLLMESERDEVRALAKELEHQSAGMCSRHRLEERVMEWWPRLVASDEASNMWVRWREQTKGQLGVGLRLIDGMLRQLPGNVYEHIDHLETVFSQLYYLCIPRAALTAILSLLVLRMRTCRELGIEMKPMSEADYEQCEQADCSISLKELTASLLKFPTSTALGMYGGMSTLMAEIPAWQKHSPEIHKQILAKAQEQQDKQEQKQEKIIETVKEAANKPTEVYYGDKNELQNGAQLLKLELPKDTDPAEIAARIAEQQKKLLE